MFRSVPRQRLNDLRDKDLIDSGPTSTKYSPSFAYIHGPITKNVAFGEKGEVANQMKLNAIYEKIKPDTLCSKGVDSCFSSVKRVKQISRNFIDETFKKRLDSHFTSDPSLLDASKSEEQLPTIGTGRLALKGKLQTSRFFADSKVAKIHEFSKMTMKKASTKIQMNRDPSEKRISHSVINMKDKDSIRRVQRIDLT